MEPPRRFVPSCGAVTWPRQRIKWRGVGGPSIYIEAGTLSLSLSWLTIYLNQYALEQQQQQQQQKPPSYDDELIYSNTFPFPQLLLLFGEKRRCLHTPTN